MLKRDCFFFLLQSYNGYNYQYKKFDIIVGIVDLVAVSAAVSAADAAGVI